MSREVLILLEAEIRTLLDVDSCMQAVEAAFTSYALGQTALPAVINLDVRENGGEVHVKAGHLTGGANYAVKIASGFPANAARGLPSNDGMVLVFDAASGAPAALLFDNGFITDRRTGAAGGVSARHLARRDAGVVGVIGCGLQARHQIEALSRVRTLREIRVYGRNAERARACAADIAATAGVENTRCEAVDSAEAAVRGADIVLTVTPSREPLVHAEWLSRGCHVTAVGSDGPDKQELHPDVLARADVVVADSRSQCLRLGEIHHAVAHGAIGASDITAELGEITAGSKPGRQSDVQITVCDLTGVGVQDVAAANVVLQRARTAGLGDRLRL